MTTTTTAATTPAPAYGPATDIAVAENANPAAAGPHAPSAAHPNPTKETLMTDQIPAGLHPDDVALARDYAARVLADPDYHSTEELAAARVLQALLPTPPPPTLADMTEAERRACRRMQADVKGEDGSAVIYAPNWKDGSATVLWPSGFIEQADWEDVTPRPDLPSLTWPGEQQPAPALPDGWRLADHKRYGRVIVTNPTPDADGHVYFVAPAPEPLGNDWHPCDPGELTYLDQEADQ